MGRGCVQSSKEGEKQRNMALALPYPSGIPEYGWFPPSSASHLPYLKSHPFQLVLNPPQDSPSETQLRLWPCHALPSVETPGPQGKSRFLREQLLGEGPYQTCMIPVLPSFSASKRQRKVKWGGCAEGPNGLLRMGEAELPEIRAANNGGLCGAACLQRK